MKNIQINLEDINCNRAIMIIFDNRITMNYWGGDNEHSFEYPIYKNDYNNVNAVIKCIQGAKRSGYTFEDGEQEKFYQYLNELDIDRKSEFDIDSIINSTIKLDKPIFDMKGKR